VRAAVRDRVDALLCPDDPDIAAIYLDYLADIQLEFCQAAHMVHIGADGFRGGH
jgi:hypothetical protein